MKLESFLRDAMNLYSITVKLTDKYGRLVYKGSQREVPENFLTMEVISWSPSFNEPGTTIVCLKEGMKEDEA